MKRRVPCRMAAAFGLVCGPFLWPAAARAAPVGEGAPAPPGIAIELNKLETTPGACRGYFVVRNHTAEPLKEMRIEVFLFDPKGVILRRVALTFLDIRAERMKVVLFDLAEAPCTEVGRLLVNDVLGCTSLSGAPVEGCADLVSVSTRAAAAFDY